MNEIKQDTVVIDTKEDLDNAIQILRLELKQEIADVRQDITKLEGLTEEYKETLYKYQKYTEISNERIDKLVNGLNRRMEYLSKYISK